MDSKLPEVGGVSSLGGTRGGSGSGVVSLDETDLRLSLVSSNSV